MTDTAPAIETDEELDADVEESAGRFTSDRGKFEIFRAPKLNRPPAPEMLEGIDMTDGAAAYFAHDHLLQDNDEGELRQAIGEMTKAIAPGNVTTPIFAQRGQGGMSIVHAWFAPNFQLFRHSHPAGGDCLYYVLAGEIVMGSQRLGPGDGFFVPNEMPYKYKAGPEGVEVLEFRSGGGIQGAPIMKLDERGIESIRRLAEANRAEHDNWRNPPKAPGGALYDPATD